LGLDFVLLSAMFKALEDAVEVAPGKGWYKNQRKKLFSAKEYYNIKMVLDGHCRSSDGNA